MVDFYMIYRTIYKFVLTFPMIVYPTLNFVSLLSYSLISHIQRIYSGYPLELCSKCYNISINLHFMGVWENMKLFRVVRTCKRHKHYSYNAHLKNKCVIRTQCIVKSHFPVLLQMITKFMAHNITSKYNCIHRIQMLSISCFFKGIKLNL